MRMPFGSSECSHLYRITKDGRGICGICGHVYGEMPKPDEHAPTTRPQLTTEEIEQIASDSRLHLGRIRRDKMIAEEFNKKNN